MERLAPMAMRVRKPIHVKRELVRGQTRSRVRRSINVTLRERAIVRQGHVAIRPLPMERIAMTAMLVRKLIHVRPAYVSGQTRSSARRWINAICRVRVILPQERAAIPS